MHAVPGALKPFDQGQFDTTRKQLKELTTFTQNHLGTVNQSVGRAEGSVFNNSYAHISPIGPWVISFGSLLVTTIDGWDDHSFKTIMVPEIWTGV